MPEVQPFLMSITSLTGQCQVRGIPFILFNSRKDRINGTVLNRIPQWSRTLESNRIEFVQYCGCDLPWHQQHLHIKKYVCVQNCEVNVPPHECMLLPHNRVSQDCWLKFYCAIIVSMFSPHKAKIPDRRVSILLCRRVMYFHQPKPTAVSPWSQPLMSAGMMLPLPGTSLPHH